MKVFQMNDMEVVAAESEEQAKKWYHEETSEDWDDINEFFEGEISLNGEMLIEIGDLPEDELKSTQVLIEAHGEFWVKKTFRWVIENEKINSPCVISSTEY